MNDGTARAWGSNFMGQLGIGTTADSSVPVVVPGLSNVSELSAIYLSAYALLGDGTVRAWGSNFLGQLGNSTVADSTVPVEVSGLTSITSLQKGLF